MRRNPQRSESPLKAGKPSKDNPPEMRTVVIEAKDGRGIAHRMEIDVTMPSDWVVLDLKLRETV